MKTHELAERVARLQHDLCILSMSDISEARLHEMLDDLFERVANYAAEVENDLEHFYPEKRK